MATKKIDGEKVVNMFLRAVIQTFIGGWILMLLLGVLANNGVDVPAFGYWLSFVTIYFVKVLVNVTVKKPVDLYK